MTPVAMALIKQHVMVVGGGGGVTPARGGRWDCFIVANAALIKNEICQGVELMEFFAPLIGKALEQNR